MTDALSKLNIERPVPVASQVTRRLLDFLFSGQVRVGDRIPSERQLTEALGVSRPAVREALRALHFMGLLDIRQGSGTYFRDPDQDLLFTVFELSLLFGQSHFRELVEARAALEVVVAGLAAERADGADIKEIQDALTAMHNTKGADFVEADIAFHGRIALAARNSVLRDMLRGVRTMVRSWVGQNIEAAATTRIAYGDHIAICDAIARHDGDSARSAMAAHMEGAKGRLFAQMQQPGDGSGA